MSNKIYILGGGISGLGAASILKDECTIVEKNDNIGGLCGSKKINGFTFDFGAHVFFSKDQKTINIFNKVLNSDFYLWDTEAWNYYHNIYFPHPVQVNTLHLPDDLKIKCITSYVKNLIERERDKEIKNYEEWCLYNFGEEFSRKFFLTYAKKFYTVPPKSLTIDWISNRILNPDIENVISGAFKKPVKNLHYISQFRYPKNGGFGGFVKAISNSIPNIKLNHKVTSIDLENRNFIINNEKKINYSTCISSIPLPEFLKLCVNLPKDIKRHLRKLNWTSILVINLALKTPITTNKHYEYYYDDEIPFFRTSFPFNLSPSNVPINKGSISIEISYNGKQNINMNDILEKSINSLINIGYLKSSNDIAFKDVENIKYGYIIFDFNRKDASTKIKNYLQQFDFYLCGRYGCWNYFWSHQALLDGINTAKKILNNIK